MMKHIRHILSILACAFILVSCDGSRDKVIPRAKLAQMYAEMLITDQWISGAPALRRNADTSLVYEPILQKYGYTSADYRKSIDKYMDDPERFSRILRETAGILDKKLEELGKRKAELDLIKAREVFLETLKYEADFNAEEFFPYLFEEPYVHYYDSLEVKPDSVLQIYRLRNIERCDTIYEGLKMVVIDSLAVRDSLALTDTIKAEK